MSETSKYLSADERNLLREGRCKELSDTQFLEFMQAVDRFQLSPFANQIHAVVRNKKQGNTWISQVTVQTGIDGFRLVADRTKCYAGSDDALHDVPGDGPPDKSTVTVYKLIGGQRCPFTASARWNEYYPGDGNQGLMWRSRPFGMLDKCAEALALRKAFPAELSGLYTYDEMQQADKLESPPEPPPPPKPDTPPPPKPDEPALVQATADIQAAGKIDDVVKWLDKFRQKLSAAELDKLHDTAGLRIHELCRRMADELPDAEQVAARQADVMALFAGKLLWLSDKQTEINTLFETRKRALDRPTDPPA